MTCAVGGSHLSLARLGSGASSSEEGEGRLLLLDEASSSCSLISGSDGSSSSAQRLFMYFSRRLPALEDGEDMVMINICVSVFLSAVVSVFKVSSW